MLAIIIPTYDSLDTLKVLIRNIFDYTDGEFKVYVIEDGQKQETIDWLRTQNVKLIIHETNKGIATSWNDGLKEAIKDDCDYFAVFNDDIELPQDWWKLCRDEFKPHIHIVCAYGRLNLFTGWFFILDKECIKRIGFFDEQFMYCAEDEDYYLRVRFHHMVIKQVKLNLFHHGSRTLNKLRAIKRNKVEETRRESWAKLLKKYPQMRHGIC